jgi:3-oxoacyl-[acyl-carrier protein] reductase
LEKEKIFADIPLGRIANPDELAKVVVFIASPAASYVNGVMLNVDGGFNKGLF